MQTNELFEQNIDLATQISQIYFKQFSRIIEYDDIKQLALIGLLKASTKYDKEKMTSFKTYAYNCMRNEILIELRKVKKSRRVSLENDNLLESLLPFQMLEDDFEDNMDTFIESDEINRVINLIFHEKSYNPRKINIVEYFIKGYTPRDIAEKFNISKQYVGQVIKGFKEDFKEYYEIIKSPQCLY